MCGKILPCRANGEKNVVRVVTPQELGTGWFSCWGQEGTEQKWSALGCRSEVEVRGKVRAPGGLQNDRRCFVTAHLGRSLCAFSCWKLFVWPGPLSTHPLFLPVFTEDLSCAKHVRGAKNWMVNKTDEVPDLMELNLPCLFSNRFGLSAWTERVGQLASCSLRDGCKRCVLLGF